jgi:D-glycero-D-manno-heptose 1,7-bisphosphate phosphatase
VTALERPAVFMDRDGILNEMVVDPATSARRRPVLAADVVLRREAPRFVSGLNRIGFLALVVTHQPDLATGALSPLRLERIHLRLRELIAQAGGRLDGIHCSASEPGAGPLLEAAREHRVDLRSSFLLATTLAELRAGQRAGIATVFVGGAAAGAALLEQDAQARPTHVVADLAQALALVQRARDERIARGP